MIKAGGVTVVLAATGTAACGLLMLAGVGPSPAAADLGDTLPNDVAAMSPYTSTTTPGQSTDTTEPYWPDTTTTIGPTSTITATTITTTTTATTTTTTTTDATTTTTIAASPVPLSVWPSSVTVGPGGSATISGSCATVEGRVLGPVQIWQVGATVTVISTDVTAAQWSYRWTAPSTPEEIVLQPWCGSPDGYSGGYPANLQVEVIFVAQDAPAPAAGDGGAGGPGDVAIPATD